MRILSILSNEFNDNFEESEFLSSKAEFRTFFKSSIWKDFQNLFEERAAYDLRLISEGLEPEEYYKALGRIQELKVLINLQTYIEQNLQENNE